MYVRRSSPPRPSPFARRSGTVLVETAIVSSVFGLFMAGIMEFGHAYMVQGTLNAAVQRAARHGSVDGVTTAEVRTMVNGILNSAFKSARATVLVKDASVFEQANVNPANVNYNSLPDLNLESTTRYKMFVVRATVPYSSVALLPPFWAKTVTLKAQSVMRHE
ncbi:TadE/TadG family type IV pilus assembly protein [Planctomicrobium sp. SH527]|uniref:TadE/TadG family type IV pilus assembly protein n=1 Tax=Planctomicrobium sp. SH527 TaxID=3448123 RepID=UPI003F5B30D1